MTDQQFTQQAERIIQLFQGGRHQKMMQEIDAYNALAGTSQSVWIKLRDLCADTDQLAGIVVYYHIRQEMSRIEGTHVCTLRLKGRLIGSVIVTAKNKRLAMQYAANAARELKYGAGVRVEVWKK